MEAWPIGTHYIKNAEIDDEEPESVVWNFFCGQLTLVYAHKQTEEYIRSMVGQWVEVSLNASGALIMNVVPAPGQREE